MPRQGSGDTGGVLFTIITNGTNDDDQSVSVVYPQPMHVNPEVIYYNPINTNAEWYGVTDVQDEGLGAEFYASRNGFNDKADNAVGGGGDILIHHYTAVGEMVVGP
jgi:hypothetical protein